MKMCASKDCGSEASVEVVLLDGSERQATQLCQSHALIFEDFCLAMGLDPGGHELRPLSTTTGGMRVCAGHWNAMRKAVADRGMAHLGAQDGQAAIVAMVTEVEGRGAENGYDPLMACHNMIASRALQIVGLALMAPTGWHCPVCMVMEASARVTEADFINGPADAALKECKEQGLL